jgi:hypothetical protein
MERLLFLLDNINKALFVLQCKIVKKEGEIDNVFPYLEDCRLIVSLIGTKTYDLDI